MPSVSKKQHNLMAMVANDPKAAKRLGIKQSVGKEFLQADKGKKFGGGGMAKCKKYEEGGLTFAEMDKEDRDAAAAAAIADLDARQAAKSAEAGGMSEKKTTPRKKAAPKKPYKAENPLSALDATYGYKKGGSVRGCGCAQRGKTRGRMV